MLSAEPSTAQCPRTSRRRTRKTSCRWRPASGPWCGTSPPSNHARTHVFFTQPPNSCLQQNGTISGLPSLAASGSFADVQHRTLQLAGTDDPTYMSRQLLHEQTIMFVQSVARTVLLQKIIDALLAGRAWMGA